MGRMAFLLTFLVVVAGGQLAVGMKASSSASVTGDEPFYLLTTQSLVSDGDLDLADEYASGEEQRFWDGREPLWKQMRPTTSGRLLAPHDPGLALLAVPAYRLGGLRGVQRFLVVLWALAMATAAALARSLGAPPAAATLAATVVGVGTPGIVYASQVYPEGPAALALAVGLVLATAPRPRPLAMAVVLVALPWLGVKYVPLAALVGGAWAWRFRRRPRPLVVATALVTAAAVHYVWWHLHTFGGLTPYATNVVWAGESSARIVGSHLALAGRGYRLYGVFLDARFGLFRWLPIAPLGLLGAAAPGRLASVPGAWLAAGAVTVCVLMASFVSITIMGWWFPGRLLVAGLPALVVPVARGVTRLPRVAAVLAAWSVAVAATLVWAARTSEVFLAVDPFTLGLPLPPAWAFPDFRAFGAPQIALSALWLGALSMLVWRSCCSSTATRSPTVPSSPCPPTWPPRRAR